MLSALRDSVIANGVREVGKLQRQEFRADMHIPPTLFSKNRAEMPNSPCSPGVSTPLAFTVKTKLSDCSDSDCLWTEYVEIGCRESDAAFGLDIGGHL
jgi:hypothetical protein